MPYTKTILALSLVALCAAAWAQLKPQEEIKYRQSAMNFLRWNMGKIKTQVKVAPERYDREQVIAAATTIAAISHDGLQTLFSEHSKTGKGWEETRVKAAYFDDPQEVDRRARAFSEEADKLVDLATHAGQQQVKLQFDKVFDACKACHKKFRAKN